jgi:hypothetical protein
LPWLVAGAALAAVLSMLLVLTVRGARTGAGGSTVQAAVPGAADTAVPDLGSLSAEERFEGLYSRVMQAARSGDQAAMTQFMPMALGAYDRIDSADADARYHAALLRVHSGDVEGSRALGDSILAMQPGHLLGYVVLGTTAQWVRDDAALAKAYREFLAHYQREMQAERREYGKHRASLEEFRRRAAGSGS